MLALLLRRAQRASGLAGGSCTQALLETCRRDAQLVSLRRATGLAAAAGGGGRDGPGIGGNGSRRPPRSAAEPGTAGSHARKPATTKPDNLRQLAGRFKSKASSNDAAGAEHYYQTYLEAGGEPQHWMLPMLLGTYGRLRQADKAWAIYQHLVGRRCLAHTGAEAAGAASGGGSGQGDADMAAPHGSGGPPALPSSQQAQQAGGGEGGRPPWDARLAAQQAQLQRSVERLVRDLRLDEVPWSHYTYGALLTALSRAEHPPYDLPAHYAAKAAAAFRDCEAAGLVPNVVLWHNLIGCQAKAGLADAAFATYRRMLAAGARPTPWTFSMLISACGRARQPHRAADVVDRLMPQARGYRAGAGVQPSVAVWNALLGAYGRAGSVDAAYAAWEKMLDSGAIPDDCTERSLALAFGSHPALAAEVVAEARQIQHQRRDAAAAAVQQDGEGGGSDAAGSGAAADADEGGRTQRPPYRLYQHRQSALEFDSVSRRSQARSPALGLPGGKEGSDGAAAGPAAAKQDRVAAAEAAEEERGLQLRQLLVLDLHGSSQAAARMVLLRRLEALALQGEELAAEVDRMAALHPRRRERHARVTERRVQLEAAHAQRRDFGVKVLKELDGSSDSSSGDSDSSSSSSSGGGGSSLTEQQPGRQQGTAQDAAQVPAVQAAELRRWPELVKVGAGGTAEGTVAPQPQLRNLDFPPFSPPPLSIITGLGRHSRRDRGGVLKAAVRQLLRQQGLPALDDPSNQGVVLVPWPALHQYLGQQRQSMEKDHFLSAARMRYLYVLSGVAGLAAAANLLPRLAPWMA